MLLSAYRLLRMENRYQRQQVIPEFGVDGQHRLAAARLLVVGAGGLGCAALPALVGAGCGNDAQRLGWLRLVDPDRVNLSNLNRQFLYSESDIGRVKVACAAEQLYRLDSSLTIETHALAFAPATASQLLAGVDLVIDCTDNLPAKLCVNHWCFHLGIPLVSASISRHSGFVQCVDGKVPPCLACASRFARQGADCATEGIVGAVAQVFGSLLANQAITFLLKGKFGMSGLWLFDCQSMQASNLKLVPDSACVVCAKSQPPAQDSLEVEWSERQANWLVVDIRNASDPVAQAATRHIPAAKLAANFALELPELFAGDGDRTLVLACNRGIQSLALAHLLKEQQPEIRIKSLRGGIGVVSV